MEIDWATVALVGVVVLFLGFAFFATFYGGLPRSTKHDSRESVGELKSGK